MMETHLEETRPDHALKDEDARGYAPGRSATVARGAARQGADAHADADGR